jgi:hypothetical protein
MMEEIYRIMVVVFCIVGIFGLYVFVQKLNYERKALKLKEKEMEDDLKHKSAVGKCMIDVLEYIDSYKPKFKMKSRFLFDVGLMGKVFPEYSEAVRREVFDRLIVKEKVRRNSMDQEWELTPPSWSETEYEVHGEQIPTKDMENIIEPGGVGG